MGQHQSWKVGLLLLLTAPAPDVVAQTLPVPGELPEEILRTEVITDARSPLDGQPLTAAEYAELEAQLSSRESIDAAVSPELRRLVTLLRLRKLIKSVFPFLIK